MLKSFFSLCAAISILISLCSCSNSKTVEPSIPTVITEESKESETTSESSTQEEKLINYIDELIFLGESTTYHLKSRGVLKDGRNTKQVWAPKSGTLMLEATICDCRIIYPDTSEEISLEEALKRKRPKAIVLTFGLNGATNFIARGENYFKFCYQKLIDLIKSTTPSTKIIVNSCFPVAKNMDMSRYTIDTKTLNDYIRTLNQWAKALAAENGAIYTNTETVVSDNEGYLANHLQAEDGYHLNAEAYKLILNCLNEQLQKLE